jgi:hypothetical protein
MNNQHPITPPPDLTDKWNNLPLSTQEIFVMVARWGADQELNACCEWLQDPDLNVDTYKLRAARRQGKVQLIDATSWFKPLSLKEQALEALETLNQAWIMPKELEAVIAIRRALEALPND